MQKNHTRENLTKDMRWNIAEQMAEDTLSELNDSLDDVQVKNTFYFLYGKRLIDIVISLIVLIITLPINLVILIVTYFDVGTPIFFKQARTGKNEKLFNIIKFRNMHNTIDDRGELLPPSQRVTKWGKFVRKTSLDELLNFWSILKGDMSIIGPRPLPPEYLIRYNKRHKARLTVRPGLECPPRKRYDHIWTWNDQLENDVWYVENLSLKTDIYMLLNLIKFVFDSKSAKARSKGDDRGTFMGYSFTGKAINLSQVPDKYIEMAFNSVDEDASVERLV